MHLRVKLPPNFETMTNVKDRAGVTRKTGDIYDPDQEVIGIINQLITASPAEWKDHVSELLRCLHESVGRLNHQEISRAESQKEWVLIHTLFETLARVLPITFRLKLPGQMELKSGYYCHKSAIGIVTRETPRYPGRSPYHTYTVYCFEAGDGFELNDDVYGAGRTRIRTRRKRKPAPLNEEEQRAS